MTFVFLGLFLILMALVVKVTIGRTNVLLKMSIHVLGGIVGLWLCDLLLSVIGIEIPINFFTILIVGVLGFPGVLAL
ncbi:MAG: pro-sigmaK processing inhibitor BofA family protein, partial [Desulfitobacterium hafniense]|nr:pro-sigmaK processing inhibitor BofA family protein [Desulfitobacterium hafniense]